MAANNECRLSNIQANVKTDLKIKVRVWTTWRQINQHNADILGLEDPIGLTLSHNISLHYTYILTVSNNFDLKKY